MCRTNTLKLSCYGFGWEDQRIVDGGGGGVEDLTADSYDNMIFKSFKLWTDSLQNTEKYVEISLKSVGQVST